jgi:hypothetical protein
MRHVREMQIDPRTDEALRVLENFVNMPHKLIL